MLGEIKNEINYERNLEHYSLRASGHPHISKQAKFKSLRNPANSIIVGFKKSALPCVVMFASH